MKIIIVAILITVSMGCASPQVSDSLYRSSEVGVSKSIVRCRVLEVREVVIRGDNAGEKGEAIGGTFGALIGSSQGDNYESSVGKGVVGSLLGGIIGRAAGDKLSEQQGLEYSIILTNGNEQTHVQNFLEGDRIVSVGETCRLQVSADGKNRVLPAEQLTDTIARPKTTTFTE